MSPREAHSTDGGGPAARDTAGNAGSPLHPAGESQALLLRLLREQRETGSPDAMMDAASRALGEHLRANRAGFFEMADDDEIAFIVGWADGVLPVLTGTFPVAGIGTGYLEAVRAGRSLGIADMRRDPLTVDSAFEEIGVRSGIGVPILRGGQWRAGLYVNHASVREWHPEEIALAREVADLTWDAVERARATQALNASQARSRAILQATSEAIALSDRDGTVLDANPAYFELYGFGADEVIGRSFAVIFPEEQREWAEGQHRAIFEHADPPLIYETRIRRKDGAERIVEARADFVVEEGRRTALVSAIRDVTDRHTVEEALRGSEERLRLALDAAGMGVFAWDPVADRTDADGATLAMLGVDPNENLSLAKALDRHIHPDDRARYTAAVEAMLDPTGAGRLVEEVRWAEPAGRERWLAFTGQAFFSGEGAERRAVRAIGSVMDVTSRRLVELERQAFAASAAHDLKTPLTSIMGQAQLMLRRLRRGEAEPARLEAGLTEVGAAAHRMVALIDEVMDAARLDAGQALELRRMPTDLVSLVEQVVEEARSTTSRHRIRVEHEAEPIIGQWDGERLARVVENLLANAIKYSPGGGEIRVRVRREEACEEPRAALEVADEGVGIPASELPYVFERFRRGGNVTGRIGGTGIGLAGASGIVAQHGGVMHVESSEGQGSTFTVVLPLDATGAGLR